MARTVVLCALLMMGQRASAVFISFEGFAEETPFDLEASVGEETRLSLQLANSGGGVVQVATAQVALGVAGLPGSAGEVGASLDTAVVSFLGAPAIDVSDQPGIITAQAGSVFGAEIPGGERRLLAEVVLSVQPGTRGEFELFALGLSTTQPLVSSQWLAPGIPPLPQEYENSAAAVSAGVLLGRVRIVPESATIAPVAFLCAAWRLVYGRSHRRRY